jgi:CubicO group peptidase (beta-lactamase class C family)
MPDIKQGFSLPPEQRIPRDQWDRAPWNRWTFQNVRQMVPTTEVWRGTGPVREFARNQQDLGKVQFSDADANSSNLQTWIDSSYTDGILLLHRGEIVFEQYHNNMTERTLHLSQSMAKSIVAAVASILIGRGLIDPTEQVTGYLPELGATAWQGATLQQVMDMTTGVRYVEDYEALDSDIAVSDIACGWKQPRRDFDTPRCIWDQILTLTKQVREHGEKFQYRSIETDVLAHCLERVTGTRLAELVSRELWQPLGCVRWAIRNCCRPTGSKIFTTPITACSASPTRRRRQTAAIATSSGSTTSTARVSWRAASLDNSSTSTPHSR